MTTISKSRQGIRDVAAAHGWELRRAANAGDEYVAVAGDAFPTVAGAQQVAQDWTPEEQA